MKFVVVLAVLAVLVIAGCTTISNPQAPLTVSVSDLNSNPKGYLGQTIQVEGTLIADEYMGPFFLNENGKRIEVTPFLPFSISMPGPDYNGPAPTGREPSMAGWDKEKVLLTGTIVEKSIKSVEAHYILDVNSYSIVE